MSIAAHDPARAVVTARRKGSAIVNYWRLTLAVTIGLLAVVMGLDNSERYVIGLSDPHRMWDDSAETAMRIIGFSHYLVAIVFMLSSRRMRSKLGWGSFAALAFVSVGLSLVFGSCGGIENPLLFLLIFFYFLAHDFRDHVHFYLNSPEAPTGDQSQHQRLLLCLQGMLLSLLVALLVPSGIALLRMRDKLPAETPGLEYFFPASVPFLVQFCVCFLPVLAVNAFVAVWLVRKYPGGARAIWCDHYPILHIFLGYAAIALATLLIGPGTFVLVTLAHFIGWYLFAERKLRSAPPRPATSMFQWIRTTLPGFRTLHLGTAAMFAVLIGLAVYCCGSDSTPALLLGESSFYYLTILHITLSFVPR